MVSVSSGARAEPLSGPPGPLPRRLAVVLLSGGLDSTTVATLARQRGYDVTAVTVQYGQVHRREVLAAEAVAKALGVRQRLVDVSFFGDLAWYSALTHPERYAVPEASPPLGVTGPTRDVPITYVPLRNTLLLALGAALLESQALHAIEVEGVLPAAIEAALFIAANAVDYSGYPDCRPEYYTAAVETLRLGSKLGTQYGVPFRIETPLIDLSKAGIIRLAVVVSAPLEHTWSCYEGGERPCGRCDSCRIRARGFAEVGLPDPALR